MIVSSDILKTTSYEELFDELGLIVKETANHLGITRLTLSCIFILMIRERRINATETLGFALRSYIMRNLPLPTPQRHKGLITITVDAWNALKIAVVEAFNEADITKTELTNRLGKQETEARRILDPNHPTKLQTLEKTLTVVGKQVIITIKDAA
ncbi:type II toxin-antitoxin system HicB family antitoxin [Bartonella sp. CB169]|uniref:type II toxin-antitoxin system HicB family antitoxin n=1 Tax=Bartonella sp. CB169 TaxID=3112257 RepID=UPI00300DD624